MSRQVREQGSAAGGAGSAAQTLVVAVCPTVASVCVVTAAAVQAAAAAWRSLSLACQQLQSAASLPASAAATEKQNHPVGAAAARLSDARGIYESLSSVLAAAQAEAGASGSKMTLNLSGAPVVYAGACRADDGAAAAAAAAAHDDDDDDDDDVGGPLGGALDLRVNGEAVVQALQKVTEQATPHESAIAGVCRMQPTLHRRS